MANSVYEKPSEAVKKNQELKKLKDNLLSELENLKKKERALSQAK